ncbi:transcriptional regulator, TetR family [Curtobacterium sp. UNCCL20]|nr:transcriptional regulator, TetR family [Curtobacterium sp. UNCCL20]
MEETRRRILDVALEALGRDPDASMADIAAAASVVRRTVYGHFPTRTDLVRTLAQQAADEMAAELGAASTSHDDPATAWADFVARVWPLTHRYRVLLALRRGEYGGDIHAVLEPVDQALARLVTRGQEVGEFGRHLPAGLLSQLAYGTVFTVADGHLAGETVDHRAAAVTSLLVLGVPEQRARALADGDA